MYTLNTHATVQALEAGGFNAAQAEAIVSAISHTDEQVATKADIALLRADLTALKWAAGLQSALILAVTARLFGLVQCLS